MDQELGEDWERLTFAISEVAVSLKGFDRERWGDREKSKRELRRLD